MKIIIPIIIFILSISLVSAFCCTNPLTPFDPCTNWDLPEDMAKEICCPINEHFDTSIYYPKSVDDCLRNFFHSDCPESSCEVGCCFDLDTNKCYDETPRSQCAGVLTTRFAGSCEEDGRFAYPVCEEGCCCQENNFYISTSRGCNGEFVESKSPQKECGYLCNANKCVEGCQKDKPFFCNNDKITEDCTGGDNIIGNDNDCGCPSGKVCQSNGKCIEKKAISTLIKVDDCTNEGYKWCEIDKKCVTSCTNCESDSIQEGNLCKDSCTDVVCGENSNCLNGECICDIGFYDEVCTAYDQTIDYERDGCVKKQPCSTKKSNNPWLLFGVMVFIALLFVLKMIRKSKPKEKEEMLSPWEKYPPSGGYRPPY